MVFTLKNILSIIILCRSVYILYKSIWDDKNYYDKVYSEVILLALLLLIVDRIF